MYFGGEPIPSRYFSEREVAEAEADRLAADPTDAIERIEYQRVRSLPVRKALVQVRRSGRMGYLWVVGYWDAGPKVLHLRGSPRDYASTYAWCTAALASKHGRSRFSPEPLSHTLEEAEVKGLEQYRGPFRLTGEHGTRPQIIHIDGLFDLDSREGEVWARIYQLIKELADGAIKVRIGITASPKLRAASRDYTNKWDLMFVVGTSTSRTRVAASEAALILICEHDASLRYLLDNPQPGGETRRQAEKVTDHATDHALYVLVKGTPSIAWRI